VAGSNTLFDFGNMEYTGSIGRAISFGNAQDAVVNSSLNLQLNGMLGDSIEIAASLSDQNLPIEPDGSTTQLNEIDKIFIQFKKKNWNLNIGDIDLRQNNHYYLNFYKRLQGISFETSNKIKKNLQNNFLISGALARGKFTSNSFQGLEGNQGPYRLQGANKEFFFIVLANTEKVYIDGEQLQRGEDQDYIINYNTAEITFMPQRLITKDKRIRVEFEYNDRNYVNSQLFVSDQLQINKKLNMRFSAYSNLDAKNSPINQTLNPAQKAFLGTIGDSIQTAYFPAIFPDTLSPGKILYKQYDTLVNSVLRKIYIYSTNKDSAKFNLNFAELGPGKGDYNLLLNGANGKVFIWVQPVGSIKQGQYEPVQFLVTPKKQQIAAISFEYTPDKHNQIKTEFSLSNHDINSFSSFDKKNDKGIAAKLEWANQSNLNNNLKINSEAAYEINNSNFKTIERLRSPEFNRDWNLPLTTTYAGEQLGSFSTGITDRKNNQFRIRMQNFRRNNGYTGFRQSLHTVTQIKGWLVNSAFSYTKTNDAKQDGLFIRPSADLNKVFSKLRNYKLGINFFMEKNKLLDRTADSLNPLSISFQSLRFSVASNDAKENKWSIAYILRNNQIPVQKSLLQSDKSSDLEAAAALKINPAHQFSFKATFRDLQVQLPARVSYKSDKTILGRAEYQINEWNGLLNGNVLMETGSGQEQKRDFAYLEVPAGQGEFFWIDYNNNGVQELNEFELAQFPDQKKFIRIYLPTNQFLKANFNTFIYTMSLNPKAKLTKQKYKGLKNIWSRSFLSSSLQVNKKEQSNNAININPFKYNIENAALITLNNIFTNSYSFNKFSNHWGFDLNADKRMNKVLLTYGYESRELNSYLMKGRVNLFNRILLENTNRLYFNKLITPGFDNRNFDIRQKSTEAKISYSNNTKIRIGTGFQTETKQNRQGSGERATVYSYSIDAKYNALQSAALNGKFTLSNIRYKGNPNSTVSYIMLEALVPGKNYLWNIDFVKTLKNNLEISFRYEGRKTGNAPTIHIGTATMRATFY
jgi:hypothetical protein